MEKLIKEWGKRVAEFEAASRDNTTLLFMRATYEIRANVYRDCINELQSVMAERFDENRALNLAGVSVPNGTVCYYKPCLDQYNGKCLHSGKYPTCKNKQNCTLTVVVSCRVF